MLGNVINYIFERMHKVENWEHKRKMISRLPKKQLDGVNMIIKIHYDSPPRPPLHQEKPMRPRTHVFQDLLLRLFMGVWGRTTLPKNSLIFYGHGYTSMPQPMAAHRSNHPSRESQFSLEMEVGLGL